MVNLPIPERSFTISIDVIKNKFTLIEIVKDLSGIGRFTIGRYK